jgi:hypothetical protein
MLIEISDIKTRLKKYISRYERIIIITTSVMPGVDWLFNILGFI